MKAPAFFTLGFAVLSALACSGVRGSAYADGPSYRKHPSWSLGLEFRKKLVAPSRRSGEPYERGQAEIDVVGRRVFVGSSDGGLYALHADSGETIWRFQTLSFVQSQPLYDPSEDAVYFGSHDGALYKVAAKDGQLLFRLSTRAEVARRPIAHDDQILFSNANDTLISANRKTGEITWSYHRTPALGMEVAGYSGPALSGGLVYMGFSDGTALAFDAKTGEEKWEPVDLASEAEEARGEVPKYLDVDTTPLIIDTQSGRLSVFGSYEGGVVALEAETGTLVWSAPEVRGVSDLEMWEQAAHEREGEHYPARKFLLVSTGNQGLWALDPEGGAVLWRRSLPQGGVSRPVPMEGALLFASSQMGVFLVSPLDGSLIDGIHVDTGVSGTPAARGRRAYVLTNGGHLLGLSVMAPRLDRNAPRYDETSNRGSYSKYGAFLP